MPQAAQCLPGLLIVLIEAQNLRQVGHCLLWIFYECGPLQPRFLVRWIDLQNCGKVPLRTRTLSSIDSISGTLQEYLNLLLWSNRHFIIKRQRTGSLLLD